MFSQVFNKAAVGASPSSLAGGAESQVQVKGRMQEAETQLTQAMETHRERLPRSHNNDCRAV